MEGQTGTDSVVLEEEIDPNYVPSEAEVLEYAKWLGMDLEKDQDLIWISKVPTWATPHTTSTNQAHTHNRTQTVYTHTLHHTTILLLMILFRLTH